MSTKKKKGELDYHDYMKTSAPDPRTKRRGFKRRRRPPVDVVKQRITIRIDEDFLEEFRRLVPSGRGYQSLINHALREWLAARGMKELLRQELRGVIQELVEKAG